MKGKDLSSQLKVVFLEALKKQQNMISQEEQDIDMDDFEIPEKEVKLMNMFLNKFTIVSENSINEHLDILLMLRALPNKIRDDTVDQTDQFNFKIFQESLIAFQNRELVQAFEYFDEKNRERIDGVKKKIEESKKSLTDVKDIMELIKIKIEKNEDHFSRNKLPPVQSSGIESNYEYGSPHPRLNLHDGNF